MKKQYHIKNPSNKKEMKKVRIKPLPLELMKDETNRTWPKQRRDEQNHFNDEVI